MLEGVDALFLNHRLHLIEDLFAPPGDGHVEGIIAIGARRLVVPALQGIEKRLPRLRQAEIHHHRRAAGKRRPRAALEIIGGIGAHEGHFQMHMRIDAARHHVTSGGIQHGAAGEIRADLGDPAALDLHIGLVGEIGGDDGAVLDDGGGHSTISAVSSTACSSTSQPAFAHSGEISSASLWESPSTQGQKIMVEGATLAVQQASWPAPEMMSM